MGKQIRSLKPFALNRSNISDFGFLVSPEATSDILSGDGTTGFVAKSDLAFVGALCGKFVKPKEYRISSIFVPEKNRKKGVGRFLLDTLYDVVAEFEPDISIDITVKTPEAKSLIGFFEAMGYEESFAEDRCTYVTDFVAVERMKIPESKKLDIRPFNSLPGYAFKEFMNTHPDEASLPVSGFEAETIDRDISMGLMDDKKLLGYAVLEKYGDDALILSDIYVEEGEPETTLMALMAAVRNEALKVYDLNTKLYIPTADERLGELVERIFPDHSLSEGVITLKKTHEHVPADDREDYSDMSLTEFLENESVQTADFVFEGVSEWYS